MSRRNGGDSVNNESAGRVVYRINAIPECYNFHISETQLTILFITYHFFNNIFINAKENPLKLICVRI